MGRPSGGTSPRASRWEGRCGWQPSPSSPCRPWPGAGGRRRSVPWWPRPSEGSLWPWSTSWWCRASRFDSCCRRMRSCACRRRPASRSCWRVGPLRRPPSSWPIVLVAAWTGWQVGTANRVEAGASVARAAAREVGTAMRTLVGDGPCAFASSEGFPQIAFASGCDGRHLRTVDDRIWPLSDRVFVVLRTPPPPGSPLAGLSATTVPAAPSWSIYELPAAPS